MSNSNQPGKSEELKKELFSLADQRKKLEDEIIMHRVVLENVSFDQKLYPLSYHSFNSNFICHLIMLTEQSGHG